jgi:hypothetical protein
MKNLLTASEAFAALQKGKTVLCRPEGDMLDFADLDQFPASIFGKQGYEFCIKAELMELAGIQFTKPLVAHEVEDDQEIFIITPTRILRTKFNTENCEIFYSVMNGFAQADAENAVLQLKALGATFGQVIDYVEVEDGFNDKPKKQRGKKESQVKVEQHVVLEKPSLVISAETQTAIVITEQTNVTTSEDVLIQPSVESAIKPNNYDDLLQSVQNAHTPEEVNSVITYTSKWTEQQRKPLLTEMHKRLSELKQTRQQENELSPLILRLQHAVDIKTLEELELEIPTRHHDVHKTLWNMAKKRRAQLNAVSNEPDYSLETTNESSN